MVRKANPKTETRQKLAPEPLPNGEDKHVGSQKSKISRKELITTLFDGLGSEASKAQKDLAKSIVGKYLQQIIDDNALSANYNVVILYDETSMVDSDADDIYTSVTKFVDKKPILFILHSTGGYIGPAYLIGKLLHEYAGEELDIVVPRRAKSAATLLCCAADRIHMGGLSELGPIDPQIGGLPALGLKSSIEHIASLVKEHPHATELFAQYISNAIEPIHLGYYERVAESAAQYAERLMQPHSKLLANKPEIIAKNLVYSYKDHGFVIDKQEAQSMFGDKVVLHNTKEYDLGNTVYQTLQLIKKIANIYDQEFYFIGSTISEPGFIKKKQ